MSVADGLRVTRVDQAASEVSIAYLLEPPGWTRLEPQSVSGDPTPGLEARLHDPLWLLTRQWQLGEFHGEDVGSPVLVHIASSTAGTDVGDHHGGPPRRVSTSSAYGCSARSCSARSRRPRSGGTN